MLKNLFSSEARIILLNQFLMHPDQEFYLRELSNQFKLSPRAVSMELKNLECIELIKKRISGKQHYYSVNMNHPLFKDLQNIFIKTIGLKNVIQEKILPFKSSIDFAFIYGSIAKGISGAESDVDLMIIGNVSSRKLSGPLLEAGSILHREINFSTMIRNEFIERLKQSDHFITVLFEEPKIFILGDPGEFERMGEKWLVKTS